MSEIITTQPSPDFYIAGGTLDPTVPSYIVRAADLELLEAVKHGHFCYVLTPRQMGKSSLMVRTAQSLQEIGISSVIIDLSAGDTKNTSLEAWYLGQVLEIAEQLDIPGNHQWWWRKQIHLDVVQRYMRFLTEVVLKKVAEPLVIFVDEIDTTLSLPFNCDDYFATIRALYNKRASRPALKRLTFVLLGVVSPSDLIMDASRTPFNIGTRIQLTDFTPEEASPLVCGLAPDPDLARQLLDQILLLTGGHPFLTQETCMRVARWAKDHWNVSEASIIVDKKVDEMFLSEAGRNTDDNLKFVLKRIVESESATKLLRYYQQIREGEILRDNELDPIIVALKLSGLVKANEGGILIVRNTIYKRVFNKTWIVEALSEREQQPRKTSKFLYDVYISYSNRDRNWVQDYLYPRLKEAGLRVWIDLQEIRAGDAWLSKINQAVEESCNMLLVLSPDSAASRWILEESEVFLSSAEEREQEQRLIPLLLKPTQNVPMFISSFQWIDFTQEKLWEARMDELLSALDAPVRVKQSDTPILPVRSSSTKYNTAAIRTLLAESFEDEDLRAFVFDYFRPLYKQLQLADPPLNTNLPKNMMIQSLIEYVDDHRLFDQLLDAIAQQKPRHYDRFRSQLEIR
jgi:hypothetical protein